MLVTYPRTAYYTILLPVIYEEDDEQEQEDDVSFIEEDTVDTCPAIIVPPLTYILIN
jgi:hypothetical protein